MDNTTYDKLDAALEKAIHGAEFWVEAIDEAAKVLGAKSASLMPLEPNFRGCWLKYSCSLIPVMEEYFAQNLHLNDFRQQLAPIIESRGYASEDDILSSREERNSIPYYTDLVSKHDVGFMIGIRIITLNGLWALCAYFDNDHPPITKEQIKQTKQLSKRFEVATRKAAEIAHQKIYEFAQFFKNTKSEIHLFDPMGDHCLKLNNKGGFSEEAPQKPYYLTDHLSEELYEELKEICSSAPSQSMSKSRQVSGDNQKLNLLAIQVPNTLRHYHMIFKVCVIATQCTDEELLKQTSFAQQYLLTEAEVNTLQLLVEGNSVNSIADLLSLKSSSIRQRLKNIYEKTNVCGQVELIGLYHQN